MTVDTAAMRVSAGSCTCEQCGQLRSAAGEIDELRKGRVCTNCSRYLPREHFYVCVQCGPAKLANERAAHAETKRELEQSKHQVQLSATSIEVLYKDLEKSRADLEALRQSSLEASAFYTRRISEEVDPLKRALREEKTRRESAEAALDDIRNRSQPGGGVHMRAEAHFASIGGQHE